MLPCLHRRPSSHWLHQVRPSCFALVRCHPGLCLSPPPLWLHQSPSSLWLHRCSWSPQLHMFFQAPGSASVPQAVSSALALLTCVATLCLWLLCSAPGLHLSCKSPWLLLPLISSMSFSLHGSDLGCSLTPLSMSSTIGLLSGPDLDCYMVPLPVSPGWCIHHQDTHPPSFFGVSIKVPGGTCFLFSLLSLVYLSPQFNSTGLMLVLLLFFFY